MSQSTALTHMILDNYQLMLVPQKRFDVFASSKVKVAIQEYLTTANHPDIVFDFAKVCFIDTTTLKMLAKLSDVIMAQKGHCSFINVGICIRIILSLTNTVLPNVQYAPEGI